MGERGKSIIKMHEHNQRRRLTVLQKNPIDDAISTVMAIISW
jgi:hypothetical protein